MKCKIYTWGCQMNEEDSEQMTLLMQQIGCQITDDLDEAEVILLNTCSVRKKPEDKVFSLLGGLKDWKKEHPSGVIGVCGCMAQIRSEEIFKRAPHVNFVTGTAHISELPHLVLTAQRQSGHNMAISLPVKSSEALNYLPSRVVHRPAQLRAYVPIMYGCDNFCTFCVVPLTRGRERSRSVDEVMEEVRSLAQHGTKEVTLLGQTVNSYGKRMQGERTSFVQLLRLVSEVEGIERIRFTSPYPTDFSDELIDAIAELPKLCEWVHLPLQSGDTDLLRDMKRHYDMELFETIVGKLRSRVPGIAITTDLMIGHPGETDQQFGNTIDAVKRIRFDNAFMFAYSPRPGTKAAEREDQIPRELKQARLAELIAVQNSITCEINKQQAGQVYELLVDGAAHKNPAQQTGLTRQSKTVNFASEHDQTGQTVRIRAISGHMWGFLGEVV
ncbi:MAG: tRNA (N6-isopentenyl adenosine(37)-C2)-methylthiotransferase MiaB [Armatimonadota bacterium]